MEISLNTSPLDNNNDNNNNNNNNNNNDNSYNNNDSDLPDDINILKSIIYDLKRRLINSNNLLNTQKLITMNLINNNNNQLLELHKNNIMLLLERNKNETYHKKQIKENEYKKYEENKKRSEKMQEELRLIMIDHKMSKTKKEPLKLIKLRKKLEELDTSQDSQKQLLTYLSIQEKMVEDLSSYSQEGNIDGCRNIIKRGVNINEVDSAGFLPLHYACSSGRIEVVQLLLEFGSDFTSYLTGMCPMVLAADGGHHEVIKILSSFGANVNETGLAGTPPIVAAAKKGHIDAVQTLLSLGALPNSQDLDGNTALHLAAKLDKPVPLLRLLLLNGANSKILNGLGHNPLQIALNCLNVPAMEILGGNGLSNTQDNNNNNNDNNQLENNHFEMDNGMNMFNSMDSIISYPIHEKSYISDLTDSIHIGTNSDILIQDNNHNNNNNNNSNNLNERENSRGKRKDSKN